MVEIPNDDDVSPSDIKPRADLSDAYLGGANLPGADLSDADLRNTNFVGANLVVKGVSGNKPSEMLAHIKIRGGILYVNPE